MKEEHVASLGNTVGRTLKRAAVNKELEDWRSTLLKDFEPPTRCNLTISEMRDIINLLNRIPGDLDLLFTGLAGMYDYGFKRGMTYQKNRRRARK